jgi:hypothetical protein
LPHFTAETLALFVKLEHQRPSQRDRDEERALMYQLNLSDEYWWMNSVLDRSRGPCHGPEYFAHHGWYRCREVREALLQASGTKPTSKPSRFRDTTSEASGTMLGIVGAPLRPKEND